MTDNGIREIIKYDHILSAQEHDQTRSWLMHKYEIYPSSLIALILMVTLAVGFIISALAYFK